MSNLAQNPLYSAFMEQIDAKLQENNGAMLGRIETMLRPVCAAMGQPAATAARSMVVAQRPGAPAGSTSGGGCGDPGLLIPPIPSSFGQWCKMSCDPCLFSNLQLDVELYSWPLVEPQLYDVDTKLNNIVIGSLPLAAGNSLTISQELRRTLSFVPDRVQISTTWTGSPQPGLLTYQWQVTQKNSLTANAAQFSNPQQGQQYECGTNCLYVPFPGWKGCTGWPIGSLAALQLVVSLAATATSTLDGIDIIVYHRRSKAINGVQAVSCCSSCGSGGSCQCGGG